MERTQRDIDIIRQSSLKAAVELMTGFQNRIELDGTKVVSMTTTVADQFFKWVTEYQQQPADDENQVNYADMLKDECHKLQSKLGIPETDWNTPCPFALSWEQGGVHELVERLRQHIHNQLTGKKHVNAFSDLNGYNPGLPKPQPTSGGNGKISNKQRRYIFALLRETGQHKPDNLTSFTSQQASALIESLQAYQ